jgi:hypothetical protein
MTDAGFQRAVDYVRHECGHLVAAKVLGFETGFIALRGHQAEAEIVLNPRINDLEQLRSYLERRIQVLYAGSLAQALRSSSVNEDYVCDFLESTANQDFAKVRELLKVCAGIGHYGSSEEEFDARIKEINDRAYSNAMSIVVQNREAIRELAVYFLRERGMLGDPEEYKLTAAKVDAHPVVRSLIEQGRAR